MADGQASLTVPVRAGELKKGHYVCIDSKPCKVVELTTSKTGKHGHAKANITAIHIFLGTKHEAVCPTSHNMEAPVVKSKIWSIVDIDDDNHITLIDDEGETLDDLDLDIEKYPYQERIKTEFEENGETEDVSVRVVSAMGDTVVIPRTGGEGYGM